MPNTTVLKVTDTWYGHLDDPANNHDKLWGACVQELSTGQGQFMATWGRRGAALSSSTKVFSTPYEARAHFYKTLKDKKAKGYGEVLHPHNAYHNFPDFALTGAIAAQQVPTPTPQPIVSMWNNQPATSASPYYPMPTAASNPTFYTPPSAAQYVTCTLCGELTDAVDPFCEHCGAQVTQTSLPVAPKKVTPPRPIQLPSVAPVGYVPSVPAPVAPTRHASRYLIKKQIGQGGFGAVYEATDTRLGNRRVALKQLTPPATLSAAESREASEAFEREAMMLSALTHPNLPRIFDYYEEGGRWSLVMDFIAGQTLEDYLADQGGKLPVSEAVAIARTLTSVLEYLHSQTPPIIFRDLKPGNVMRTADGHLYLIDFGIARNFKPGQSKDTSALGSPGYAAPEQYGKAQSTPRTDVYALGAMLHQMISGADPSDNPFAFAPLAAGGQAPKFVRDLVGQMTNMNASLRPANMADVRTVLAQFNGQRGASVKLSPAPRVRKSPTPPAMPNLRTPTKTVRIGVLSECTLAFTPYSPYKVYRDATTLIEELKGRLSRHDIDIAWQEGLPPDASASVVQRAVKLIAESDILVVCLTPEFLTDPVCVGLSKEVVKRYSAAARFSPVPVVLQKCNWIQSPLSSYVLAPTGGQALDEMGGQVYQGYDQIAGLINRRIDGILPLL